MSKPQDKHPNGPASYGRRSFLFSAAGAGLAGAAALVMGACADDPVPRSGGEGGAGGSGDATGAVSSDCEALCDAAIALGCEDPTCAPDCRDAHAAAGACQDTMESYVACLAAHAAELESCTVYPRECQLQHDDFFACGSGEGCGIVECPRAPEGSCACQAFCSGTPSTNRQT